jgi:hypothetical protein
LILVNAKRGELLEMIIMLDDDMIKFLVLLNTRGVTAPPHLQKSRPEVTQLLKPRV